MKQIKRFIFLPATLLLLISCSSNFIPPEPDFLLGAPCWAFSPNSEVYQELQSDPQRIAMRDALATDPHLGMQSLETMLVNAPSSEKVVLLWGLHDFLGMEQSYREDIRQHAASILVEEYANRDQFGGIGTRSLFLFDWVFCERDLLDTPINQKAQLALRERLNRDERRLRGLDIWFFGIHDIPGGVRLAQDIQSEYRAYLSAYLTGGRSAARYYPLVPENVFFSYLLQAVLWDAHLLLEMYASFSPQNRANSLYWLSFIEDEPAVDQYLLWIAYSHPRAEQVFVSDEYTRRIRGRVNRPPQLPEGEATLILEYAALNALIRRHSEYPYPDFLAPGTTDLENAVQLGREWISNNLDHNYLRSVGVL